MEELLTPDFWGEFARFYNAEQDTVRIANAITEYSDSLFSMVIMDYEGLAGWTFDEISGNQTRARLAFIKVGHAFAHIFDVMMEDYDPYANYFTDREYNDDGRGGNTRTGSVESTPEGGTSTTFNGDREHEYEQRNSVGQGTTYDSATTDESSNDFYNISKTIYGGTERDSYNGYGSTTTYQAGSKTTTTYRSLNDAATSHKEGEEHRSGNSGIFAKQDLANREVELRLRHRIFPILVRMVVDVFNTGVWQT